MSETVTTSVNATIFQMMCGSCGGEMRITPASPCIKVGEAVSYQHKCDKCEKIIMYDTVYPYITWDY